MKCYKTVVFLLCRSFLMFQSMCTHMVKLTQQNTFLDPTPLISYMLAPTLTFSVEIKYHLMDFDITLLKHNYNTYMHVHTMQFVVCLVFSFFRNNTNADREIISMRPIISL